jgi:hypothetical protein
MDTMSSEVTATERAAAAAKPTMTAVRTSSALWAGAGHRAVAAWQVIEHLLVRTGDWLNPILVKETRQALKSFQFTITFVLVLVACWVVTMGGVAIIGPKIFYSAAGGTLLWWYYIVLAFPLAVVVPYAAFRSLAAEREDNTYDLLSITTLKPRQIISGKLGSSVVQMAVYFSAITPCLAFTYLLRGVDVPTIVVLLVYTFFGSLGLSMVGILLATLSEQRFAQMVVSVAFIALLLWIFSGSIWIAGEMIQYGPSSLGDEEFWIATLALATAYGTTFALSFFAATGMITFTSENRSTPLRICMLVQQAAWIGWMSYAWIYDNFGNEILLILATFAVLYWYAMGTLLTAEKAETSQRVKRRLPSSSLGRLFLTWFNPGPASGYMFVVANATAIAVICLLALVGSSFSVTARGGWPGFEELFHILAIGWGYLVAYLGIGLLVVRALRRFAVVTMLACVLIHCLLLLAGSGIPTAIQLMSVELRYVEYSFLQITNPFWSLAYVAHGGMMEAHVLILIVPAVAVCVLLLNLRHVIRELRQVRIALPPRVERDEIELHPPPAAMPSNPWEEGANS